jgi:hypothetical protein
MATAQADWRFLTPEQMAEHSPVIVVGEYLGQQNQLLLGKASSPVNIGVVQVQTWLKGGPATAVVLLVSALPQPGGGRSSVDVPLVVGQSGLWYLRQRPDGLFYLDRPDRFVPMAQAEARIKALHGRPGS